ncbi:MAG: hypothetical protein HS116_18135 [Planctomycetes bacterium]|nr:hypothetical protein [Planctomycetota bacterium]
MRMLVIGLGLILGTVAACLFWGGQTDQPEEPPLTTETRNSAGPTPMIEVAQAPAAPAAIEPLSEPRTQARELAQRVRIAETLAHQAVRPDQLVDAQLVRASLYDAQGRHEEANAALLHAADVSASEAAETSAKNPASPQPTPEHAAALTVLSHAHRELVRKNFEGARRHLNLVVETYAETAPVVAQQALSDLQWIASQEQQAERPAEALALSLVAGKRDIGDSSCHQKSIVPATSMGGSEIFANAVAGTSYTITASGIWAQDPDPSFNTGPNGFTGFGPIGGGEFAGMLFGTFAVREPGSSTWIAVGAGGTVTATADGPLVGAFADIAFAYNDNNGAMFVTVSSSECPPPPPAETLPPTAVNEVSPETFYLDDRGIWLDASLSTDNDTEGEDPAIRWYNWNLKSRTNPAQRAIIVEGQEALQSIYPTAPGEYDLVLTVTDNDGETASTSRVVKAVRVFFDPGYLEIPVGQTMVTVATVVPASAEGEVLFSTPNPETISLEAGGGGAGSISIAATGLSEGSTSILGYLESEPDRQGYMSVNVIPADPMTLPPTAIAATTTPVICAGGAVALDGSGSHDTDAVGAEPNIVTYTWTIENLTNPAIQPLIVTTSNALANAVLSSPGEYEVTLVVTDNDGDKSGVGTTEAHTTIIAVGVQFDPESVVVEKNKTATTVATIVPSNAFNLVEFLVSDTQVATVTPRQAALAQQSLLVSAGPKEGLTTLSALVQTASGSETCQTASIQVVKKVPKVKFNGKRIFGVNQRDGVISIQVEPEGATILLESNSPTKADFAVSSISASSEVDLVIGTEYSTAYDDVVLRAKLPGGTVLAEHAITVTKTSFVGTVFLCPGNSMDFGPSQHETQPSSGPRVQEHKKHLNENDNRLEVIEADPGVQVSEIVKRHTWKVEGDELRLNVKAGEKPGRIRLRIFDTEGSEMHQGDIVVLEPRVQSIANHHGVSVGGGSMDAGLCLRKNATYSGTTMPSMAANETPVYEWQFSDKGLNNWHPFAAGANLLTTTVTENAFGEFDVRLQVRIDGEVCNSAPRPVVVFDPVMAVSADGRILNSNGDAICAKSNVTYEGFINPSRILQAADKKWQYAPHNTPEDSPAWMNFAPQNQNFPRQVIFEDAPEDVDVRMRATYGGTTCTTAPWRVVVFTTSVLGIESPSGSTLTDPAEVCRGESVTYVGEVSPDLRASDGMNVEWQTKRKEEGEDSWRPFQAGASSLTTTVIEGAAGVFEVRLAATVFGQTCYSEAREIVVYGVDIVSVSNTDPVNGTATLPSGSLACVGSTSTYSGSIVPSDLSAGSVIRWQHAPTGTPENSAAWTNLPAPGSLSVTVTEAVAGDLDVRLSFTSPGGKTCNSAPYRIVVAQVDLSASPGVVELMNTINYTVSSTPTALPAGYGHEVEIRRHSETNWYVLSTTPVTAFTHRTAGSFRVRGSIVSAGRRCISGEVAVVVQFPSIATILADPGVIAAGATAWASTLAATTPTTRREEGAWVLVNTLTGAYSFGPAFTGPNVGNNEGAYLPLPNPPVDTPTSPTPIGTAVYTVAWFHTHTPTFYRSPSDFPSPGGRGSGPSTSDHDASVIYNMPGIAYDYTIDPVPPLYPLASPAGMYPIEPPARRPNP